MVKKDHFIFGIVIGMIVPFGVFSLIWVMNYFLLQIGVAHFYLDLEDHVLLSFAGNLLPIRYYFINLTFDKTGRGILLITFALIMIFFIFKDSILQAV